MRYFCQKTCFEFISWSSFAPKTKWRITFSRPPSAHPETPSRPSTPRQECGTMQDENKQSSDDVLHTPIPLLEKRASPAKVVSYPTVMQQNSSNVQIQQQEKTTRRRRNHVWKCTFNFFPKHFMFFNSFFLLWSK